LPGNVHVVYLKNAEAVKLAQTLRSIISGDTSALPASTGLSNTGSAANGTNSPLTSIPIQVQVIPVSPAVCRNRPAAVLHRVILVAQRLHSG
jgi:hypothetical protein